MAAAPECEAHVLNEPAAPSRKSALPCLISNGLATRVASDDCAADGILVAMKFLEDRRGILRGLLAGSTLFLLAGCGQDEKKSTGAPTGRFHSLTYNVAGLPKELSGSEPDVNMPLISPLLNDYDLVLVQEDWLTPDPNPLAPLEVYHALLAADAEHAYQSTPAPLPLGSNPVRPEALMSDGLNVFSKIAFGEVTRVAWEGCFGGLDRTDGGAADCLAFKGFAVTEVTLADGVTIDVYDLHGEAGGTQTDQDLSQADFAQLAAYIGERSKDRPVLIGGDTNLHTSDGHPDGHGDADAKIWSAFLSTTGLHDVCEVITDCESSIDKMAFRSTESLLLEPLSHVLEREKFRRSDGVDLSDHLPLAVEFEWSSAAP